MFNKDIEKLNFIVENISNIEQIINPKHLQEKLEDALKKYLDKKISNSRKYVYDIIANRFKIRGKND